jgi:glutathione S-transferase
MIKLYHCVEARSFRPLWALEELRLPYQLHVLPFPPRAHAKSFLQINPLGTIPLLIDGDTRMTESSAICEYLVARYGGGERGGPVAIGPNDADFGRYLNYLSFGEATLTFPIAIYMRYTRMEPPERKLPQAAEDYRRFFFGRLRVMAQILEAQDYLCAAGFSAADISVGHALNFADFNGLGDEFPDSVKAYLDRLRQRDGWRRAKAAEEASPVVAEVSE